MQHLHGQLFILTCTVVNLRTLNAWLTWTAINVDLYCGMACIEGSGIDRVTCVNEVITQQWNNYDNGLEQETSSLRSKNREKSADFRLGCQEFACIKLVLNVFFSGHVHLKVREYYLARSICDKRSLCLQSNKFYEGIKQLWPFFSNWTTTTNKLSLL